MKTNKKTLRQQLLPWRFSDTLSTCFSKIPCSTALTNAFESSGLKVENADSFEKTLHDLETKFYRFLQDGKCSFLVESESISKVITYLEETKLSLAPEIYAAEDYDSEQPVIVMEDYCNCFVMDTVDGFSEKQVIQI